MIQQSVEHSRKRRSIIFQQFFLRALLFWSIRKRFSQDVLLLYMVQHGGQRAIAVYLQNNPTKQQLSFEIRTKNNIGGGELLMLHKDRQCNNISLFKVKGTWACLSIIKTKNRHKSNALRRKIGSADILFTIYLSVYNSVEKECFHSQPSLR